MREKLDELLTSAFIRCDSNFGMPLTTQVADYLLENGVIVPPMPMTKELHKELVDYVYNRCIDEL